MMGPGIVVGSGSCCGGQQSPAAATEAPCVTQSPHWQGKGAALAAYEQLGRPETHAVSPASGTVKLGLRRTSSPGSGTVKLRHSAPARMPVARSS
jgi:hypothetical protein